MANSIYEIPLQKHDPPGSLNALFENFLPEFCEAVANNIDFYKELSKVITQIKDLATLTTFVENHETTEIMMRQRTKHCQRPAIK